MLKLNARQLSLGLALLLSCQSFAIPLVKASQETLTQPLLGETTLFESSHQTSGIAAHDNTPLGGRTPLVLVHGIGGTASKDFHWENFLSYASTRQDFQKSYTIYLFHYDSTRPVPILGQDLKRELTKLISASGNKTIKVVGYSEGGLLTRHAMDDPFVYAHTQTVLTIATPFHGSPLANPEWLKEETQQGSRLSLVRMNVDRAYDITGRRYPTFKEDFHWDNFDGAIEADRYEKNHGKQSVHDFALDDKKEFITYGSYFGVSNGDKIMPEVLDLKAPLPKEEPKFNLFKKNILFTLVRSNIARLPIAPFAKAKKEEVALQEINLDTQGIAAGAASGIDAGIATHMQAGFATLALAEDKQPAKIAMAVNASQPELSTETDAQMAAETSSMMAYNDGISPISSSLWLGRFTPKFSHVANPVKRLWLSLESLKGNRNTRLFAGLDHRNWMDGTTRTNSNELKDLLNPDQKSKTVFEWIIDDLMG